MADRTRKTGEAGLCNSKRIKKQGQGRFGGKNPWISSAFVPISLSTTLVIGTISEKSRFRARFRLIR